MKLFCILYSIILLNTCTSVPAREKQQAAAPAAQPDSPEPTSEPAPPAQVPPEQVAEKSQADLEKRTPTPTPENDEFSLEYLSGKFDPAQHPDFVRIEKIHSDEEGRYLRKDAYENFQKMWRAAQAEGVRLTIISATRNFYKQKEIWEAKWTGARLIEEGANAAKKYPDPKTRALKILLYSSMPGTSRHHWGTDIDLNDLNNFAFEKGEGKKVYDWLRAHAHEYGFCQPYTAKGKLRPNGYNEEKWHWSYLPVAKKLTDLASKQLKDEQIGGFKGAETATEIGIVKNYVLGINKECL